MLPVLKPGAAGESRTDGLAWQPASGGGSVVWIMGRHGMGHERAGVAIPKLTLRMMPDPLSTTSSLRSRPCSRRSISASSCRAHPRWHLLLRCSRLRPLLRGRILHFRAFKNKWRFTSLPDLMVIIKVSTVLAMTLLVLDYVLLAPNIYGTFLSARSPSRCTGSCRSFFLVGLAHCLPLFPVYPYAAARARGGFAPTIGDGTGGRRRLLLRGIESGAVKKIRVIGILSPSPPDRSQSIRGVPVLGDIDELERMVPTSPSMAPR